MPVTCWAALLQPALFLAELGINRQRTQGYGRACDSKNIEELPKDPESVRGKSHNCDFPLREGRVPSVGKS
jgi:hypothetical protein